MKRLLRYLSRYKGRLFIALILSLVGNLLALVGPKLSGQAMDLLDVEIGNVDFKKV